MPIIEENEFGFHHHHHPIHYYLMQKKEKEKQNHLPKEINNAQYDHHPTT